MLESITERMAKAPRESMLVLSGSASGNEASLTLGDKSFSLKSDSEQELTHGTFDFALFGAAAIAIRNNISVSTDLPVSAEAVAAVRQAVDMLDMWRVRRCYPVTKRLAHFRGPTADTSRVDKTDEQM